MQALELAQQPGTGVPFFFFFTVRGDAGAGDGAAAGSRRWHARLHEPDASGVWLGAGNDN